MPFLKKGNIDDVYKYWTSGETKEQIFWVCWCSSIISAIHGNETGGSWVRGHSGFCNDHTLYKQLSGRSWLQLLTLALYSDDFNIVLPSVAFPRIFVLFLCDLRKYLLWLTICTVKRNENLFPDQFVDMLPIALMYLSWMSLFGISFPFSYCFIIIIYSFFFQVVPHHIAQAGFTLLILQPISLLVGTQGCCTTTRNFQAHLWFCL